MEENSDVDAEHDALGMNEPNIECDPEASPIDTDEVSVEEEDFTGDDTSMPLGKWTNLSRRSRRIAGREPSANFVDVEPLENHGTMDSEVSLLHLALDAKSEDADKFEPTCGDSPMLQEDINAQKSRNNTRFLENYVRGFMLNQMSSQAGTREHEKNRSKPY